MIPPPPVSPEQAVDKLVEIDTKLIGTAFDKASGYTNFVLAAGYAAFFGLWAATKPYLGKTAGQLAAIFVLASATCFVFFEVYKMWKTAADLETRRARLVEKIRGKSLSEVLAEYQRIDREEKEDLFPFIPTWRVCLLFTVVTALLGIGILMASLVHALFTGAA
jgi:hypothetical protein